MAAALGDLALVRRHLDEDPGSIAMRVDQDWFPMVDTAKNGGHIYQWTLGFHVSAFEIARRRGHRDVLDLLMQRADPLERLLDALWRGDGAAADAAAAEPGLVKRAPPRPCIRWPTRRATTTPRRSAPCRARLPGDRGVAGIS
jgi:hypothetical protein